MKNPFTAKLHARIGTLESELRAMTADRDQARAKLGDVEPTVEEKAQVRAIELIASTGTLGPIATAAGQRASGDAPRTKAEFFERYNRLEGEDAGAFFDKHQGLLDE